MAAFTDEHIAAICGRDRHDRGAGEGRVGIDNQLRGEVGRVAADEEGALTAKSVQGAERLRHPLAEIACVLRQEGDVGEIFLKVSDVATVKEHWLQGSKGNDGLLQGEVVKLRGLGKREGGTEAGLDLSRLRFPGKDAESAGPGFP